MRLSGGKVFLKILTGVAGLILILGFLGYLVLFSPVLANIQKIISLRNSYETQVFNWRKKLGMPSVVNCGPLGVPVRALKTMNEHGYKYLYSVKGVLANCFLRRHFGRLSTSLGARFLTKYRRPQGASQRTAA